jgi:hypothetical protein
MTSARSWSAMTTVWNLLLLLVAAGPGGCTLPANPVSDSAYRYTSYDTAGTLVVRGRFTMDIVDSSISGEWHFAAVGNAQNIGPQTGDGTLAGSIHGTTLLIELNPQYRDNNVELSGSLHENRLSGIWTWISFVGITNRGAFEAVKP